MPRSSSHLAKTLAKTLAALLMALIVVVAVGVPAYAQPANDDCAMAEVIPGGGPFPILSAITPDITLATSTGDPPLPSCQTNAGLSIWYSFTPTATALYTVSDCADAPTGTTVDDTVISIYTSTGGCGGTFTEVATTGLFDGCDDDACVSEALQSVIMTQLNAGTQYFIVVWKFSPTTPPTAGNTAVQLRISQAPLPMPPTNDTCAAPLPLTLGLSRLDGSLALGTNDYQLPAASPCFTGLAQNVQQGIGRDVVYSFTAPSAGNYSFRAQNLIAGGNLMLYLASDCPAATPGTPVIINTCIAAANRNSLTAAFTAAEEIMCVPLTAGQSVFLYVDEVAVTTTGGAFGVEVTECTRETEPNDLPATANTFLCETEGSITPAADADFYSLGTPVAGSRVFAAVMGLFASSTDFDLRVTTTTDTLEYDDLDGDVTTIGSLAPTIAGRPLTGVASFLRVNHFSATTQTEPYRLYAVVQPPITSATVELEPNDTIATANANASNYFSGNLSASTDVDFYGFAAAPGDVLFLSLDGDPPKDGTPINAALQLQDANGTIIFTSNDASSSENNTASPGTLTGTTPTSPSEAIVFRVITGGNYYARVFTTATLAGDYLLSISRNCQLDNGGLATATPTPTNTPTNTPTRTPTNTPTPAPTSTPTSTNPPPVVGGYSAGEFVAPEGVRPEPEQAHVAAAGETHSTPVVLALLAILGLLGAVGWSVRRARQGAGSG
jgi:hypothetical protein